MSDLIIKGRARMAEIVGRTVNGLIKMEQRGLPIHKKGVGPTAANLYHLPSVVQWLQEDQRRQLLESNKFESFAELTKRRALAEARRAEVEVAKLEGSVASIELLRKGLDGVVLNQRTTLLSLSKLIGREIDDPDIRRRVQATIDRQIRAVLEVLANYDLTNDPGADAGGEGGDDD